MRRHLKAIARVATLLGVTLAVLLYVDYRVARAAVFERLLGLGARMAPYLDDAATTEMPRIVHINGARFYVAAGNTAHPPEQVRKFYKDRYSGKDGGLSDFAAQLGKHGALPRTEKLGTMDFGDEKSGAVAALDFGDGKSGIRELAARMKTLVDTGSVGDLARLRYCYTEKNGKGGTRFLTVWTDDRFNLWQLAPRDGRGDAPGFDLDGVPRYPGTSRILSSEEVGMPQRMVIYEGPGSADTARLFYRGRLGSMGWSEDPKFAQIADNQNKVGLHFTKNEHELFLTLGAMEQGQGLTIVAIQTH